jgi:hypothetical protein
VARKLKTGYWKIGVLAIAIAAVAVAASAAWAAIPDAEGMIHACADRDGRLRVVDTDAGKTCKASEKQLSWAATAPPPPEPPPEPPPAPPPAQLPDAFVAIRGATASVQPTDEVTAITTLELPAGNYLVTAKARVGSQGTATDDPVRVWCSLEPGSPADDSAGLLLAPVGSPGETQVITLLVSKELAQPGSVRLACWASGNAKGASVSEVVVRAIEVGTITTQVGFPPLP